MEISYNMAKKMDVVNVTDGKHLGKLCDVLFDLPENKIRGFYVTGGKGLRFTRQDLFVPVTSVVRVGEDVILTDLRDCLPLKNKKSNRADRCQPQGDCAPHPRRNFDEYE